MELAALVEPISSARSGVSPVLLDSDRFAEVLDESAHAIFCPRSRLLRLGNNGQLFFVLHELSAQ